MRSDALLGFASGEESVCKYEDNMYVDHLLSWVINPATKTLVAFILRDFRRFDSQRRRLHRPPRTGQMNLGLKTDGKKHASQIPRAWAELALRVRR